MPWSKTETPVSTVLAANSVSIVISPGDGSEDSWRRISRRLSEVLAKLPGGEADVSILDGFARRDLGALSRRTPVQRLIPADARAAVFAGSAADSHVDVAPQSNSLSPEGVAPPPPVSALSASQLEQMFQWLGSEPRGWALVIWMLPEAAISGEMRDFVVARLLRGAALSRTRLRLESTDASGAVDGHALLAGLAPNGLVGPFRLERDVPSGEAPRLAVTAIPGAPFSEGFHLHRMQVRVDAGDAGSAAAAETGASGANPLMADFPWLSVAEGSAPPGPVQFERVRYLEQQLAGRAPEWRDGSESARTEAASQVRAILELNASAREALRMGVEISRALGHPATAVDYQSKLLALEAPDAESLAVVGIAAFDALQFDEARRLLERATSLGTRNARGWHLLAVLDAMDGKDGDALLHSAKALELGANDLYLHLLRADAFARRKDERGRAESLVAAGRAGVVPIERRLETASVLLTLNRSADAVPYLNVQPAELPEDPAILERFAMLAESADRQSAGETGAPAGSPTQSMHLARVAKESSLAASALAAWQRILALEKAEPEASRLAAHRAIARLHYAAGRDAEAAMAARVGLQQFSSDVPLLQVLVDTLRQRNLFFEARRELEARAGENPERSILERMAFLEDQTGGRAADLYRKLLERPEPSEELRAQWRAAGLRCAQREGDLAAIAWFSGDTSLSGPAPQRVDTTVANTSIRGGRRAVFTLLGGGIAPDPPHFIAALSRVIRSRTSQVAAEQRKAYQEMARDTLRTLDRLVAMASPVDGGAVLQLRTATKAETQASARWLKEIGFDLGWRSGHAVLERITKGDAAQGQLIAVALGVDEVALEDSVKAQKEFAVRIPVETVPLFAGEGEWFGAWGGPAPAGGFVGFLVEHPDAAALYLAFSQMESEARAILATSVGLRRLAERHGQSLLSHGPSLEVKGGRVIAPGGSRAGPAWQAVLRADPGKPSEFLAELLRKDDGDGLTFYARLASLDLRHQQFFTASARRLEQFYKAFRETPAVRGQQAREIDQPMAMDFFRELSLDAEGRVLFPGSAEVWTVVRANATDPREIARRAKRLARAVPPEREDEILLRLLKEDYELASHHHGLYESFLAVARIDSRRREYAMRNPGVEALDEDSAFLLAELSGVMQPLYGYFAELPFLSADDFRTILAIVARYADGSPEDRNVEAGQLHGMLYTLALATHQETLPLTELKRIFEQFLSTFPEDSAPPAAARVTLRALREIAKARPALREDDVGLHLFAIVAPWVAGPNTLPEGLRGALATEWLDHYRRLMEAQQVPALANLLAIDAALEQIVGTAVSGANKEQAEGLESIGANLQKLPEHAEPGKGVPPSRSRNLERYRLAPAREAFRKLQLEMRRGTGQKPQPVRADRVSRYAEELMEAISPQVTLALNGILYARFFKPDDLLIGEDPLFLRRHEYIPLRPVRKSAAIRATLEKSGGPEGSFVVGGFEGIARIAGLVGADSSANQSPQTEQLLTAELAAIRATDWARFDEAASQRFAAQLQAARDWVVSVAGDPTLRQPFENATYGLIANARRAVLFEAMDSGDWAVIWKDISATDLLRLAPAIPRDLAEASPALAAWFQFGPDLPMLAELGPPLDLLQNRIFPSFGALPPYEDSAARPYPALAVSRFAESKVYFAQQLARKGLAAAGMSRFAESAIRAILAQAKITGPLDWKAVLETYRSIALDQLAAQESIEPGGR